MKEETKQLIEDSILVKIAKESYIKKEDFIEMLNKLKFTEIKSVRIKFITGYQVEIDDDDGQPYVKTLGYDIEID